MQIGNYDILSGATEFLTLNSNAKSRVSASLLYNYTRGGQLVTSSLTQDQSTIQMVTGSNTIGDPDTEGQLDTSTTLTFISGQVGNGASQALPIPSGINVGASSVLLSEYSLQSIGGPGSGGKVRVIFSTNGDIIATSGLNTTGDVTELSLIHI